MLEQRRAPPSVARPVLELGFSTLPEKQTVSKVTQVASDPCWSPLLFAAAPGDEPVGTVQRARG